MVYTNVIRLFRGKPDLQFLARVNKGTHVNMLEFDLSTFKRTKVPFLLPKDWEGMVRGWMNSGATIDMFSQEIHPEALSVMASLQNSYQGFRLYNFSDMPAEALMQDREDLKIENVKRFLEGLRTYHFTTFQNPDQLWTEGYHSFDDPVMYDCEFIPEPVIQKDEDRQHSFKDKLEIFSIIREYSSEMNIPLELLAS